MSATATQKPMTVAPSPAAAYEVTAGPPFGISTCTSQVHQCSGTARWVGCGRSNTRAIEVAEPGATSTVQASNSSWHTVSPCASTSVNSPRIAAMTVAFRASRAARLAVPVQSGYGRPAHSTTPSTART